MVVCCMDPDLTRLNINNILTGDYLYGSKSATNVHQTGLLGKEIPHCACAVLEGINLTNINYLGYMKLNDNFSHYNDSTSSVSIYQKHKYELLIFMDGSKTS